MVNKQIKIKFIGAFLVLLLFAVVLVGGWTTNSPAYAYTIDQSALTDLQKDSSFNVDDFPTVANDYSIQVIQIAETTDGELLIYTYQPCQNTKYLIATKINMSLTERMGENIATLELAALSEMDKPKVYDLILLSCEGVFCKYVVSGFTVSKNISRYYNIASIYREAIDEDGGTGTSNILGHKSYEVAQLWTAVTYNGNVGYSKTDRTVVEIRPDQKYVGKVRYFNGTHWTGWYDSDDRYCDGWYVAFDCNWKIDELYEADVTYSQRSYDTKYTWWGASESTDYGDWQRDILVTAERDTTVQNQLDGWYGRQHEWQEIQSVSKFTESEDLTDEAKERLKDKQWVIRFALTEFKKTGYTEGVSWHEIGTEIADVSIIRLLFKSNGKIYNLGVVDSMHTPDPDAPPDNNPDMPDLDNGFFAWLSRTLGIPETVLKVIAAVLALVILLPILSAIFPFFGQFLMWVIKGIAWLICLPFKAIAKLFKRKKE